MRVTVFSAKSYDRRFFTEANEACVHEFVFMDTRLSAATAVLARGADAVCAFVNDVLDAPALSLLADGGVRLVAMRCAGYNNVDLQAARRLGMMVARVPAYSPHAVAEHTLALILALNRKIHRAFGRVREGNFALDGLLGFDLHGKTAGVVGTGQIGEVVVRVLRGFGCTVLAFDPQPSAACKALGARYVSRDELLAQSDLITLHCPLTSETRHWIDADALARVKPGLMLVNTSRGAIIDTRAVIDALKKGILGSLGLDVYEEEANLFFEDLSGSIIGDDVFARLLTFPNVLITGHQAFFTAEALGAIAQTTLENLTAFEQTGQPLHPVAAEQAA